MESFIWVVNRGNPHGGGSLRSKRAGVAEGAMFRQQTRQNRVLATRPMCSSPIKQTSSSSSSFELELSSVFLVGLIKRKASQMFPNKQIHADPEDCPTVAELLPLKRKEQTIKTETRKQKGESQNNQSPEESAVVTKSTKTCPTVGGGFDCS